MTSYEYEDTSDDPTVSTASMIIAAKLPLAIAKACKPIVCSKVAGSNPALQQILCEPSPDLAAPTEAQVFSAHKRTNHDTGKLDPSDVELVISSKGYREPEFFPARGSCYTFPAYKDLSLDGSGSVSRIGFDVSYMDLMLKVNKALGLSGKCWSLSFTGDALSPTVWEAQQVDGIVTRVQLIVMPVRLT